jgi:protein involved in polysaccharide export with SLBB domain
VALCIPACSAGPNNPPSNRSLGVLHETSREQPASAVGPVEPPKTTAGQSASSNTNTGAEPFVNSSAASESTPANPSTINGGDTDTASNIARLQALRQSRSEGGSAYDFAIGPGDVIQISVPAIEALKDRTVRVSGDNTIGLPLVGVMTVAGMTEKQVRDALKLRLQQYMYNPQVEVFVKEYRTRQIAISGAVKDPGVYTLASPSDTILQMISRAGGMTDEAAPHIILIPGASAQNAPVETSAKSPVAPGFANAAAADPPKVASLAPVLPLRPGQESLADNGGPSGSQQSMPRGVPADLTPVVIDVSSINSQTVLDLPARPGDVVIVPAAGQVMVQGWVQNPGAYKITPDMTAFGAVGAAGGALFSNSAEILRTGSNGQRVELPVDLSDGPHHENADLPVQAGDVLIVQRSVVGSVPYLFYSVLSKFATGMYIPVP